jgi:protein required for attachment to host cells
MKPITTWILIANGARARVLEHISSSHNITAVKDMEYSQESLSSSEIMADKPGRAFSTAGTSRSAMQPATDPVAKREADFAHGLAEILNDKFSKKAFNRLVIFAAPKTLGDIREALSENIKTAIIAEIAKDLTKVPNDKIAKHLEDVMVV